MWVKSQLHQAMDRNHIDKNAFETHYDQIDHIEKMNSSLISYLKKSELKGWKFQNVRLVTLKKKPQSFESRG